MQQSPCPAGNKIPLPQRDPSDFVHITRVVNKEDILAEGPRDVLLSKVDRAQQMQLGDDRLSVTSRKGYRMVRQAPTYHSRGQQGGSRAPCRQQAASRQRTAETARPGPCMPPSCKVPCRRGQQSDLRTAGGLRDLLQDCARQG